jgi:hypothetical protein
MEGYDYDYLVPLETMSRVVVGMTKVWPNLVLERGEGQFLSPGAFVRNEIPLAKLGHGICLYRDHEMREQFHRDGGFMDVDGSAPIVNWIYGWDSSMELLGFVMDLAPPSTFLRRFQDVVAMALFELCCRRVIRNGSIRYVHSMDHRWVEQNWPVVLALDSVSAESKELLNHVSKASRSYVDAETGDSVLEISPIESLTGTASEYVDLCFARSLEFWYRISFVGKRSPFQQFTMPPGMVDIQQGAMTVTGTGAPMTWKRTHQPERFKPKKA